MTSLNQQYCNGYNVDLVFCIDKTGSMQYIIDEVKSNALNLHNLILNEMAKSNLDLNALRIRVVAFGCIGEDKEKAFKVSDFFEMPEDADYFSDFVTNIEAEGGGEESGLNALALSLASPWNRGAKMRQIIMMFTDEDSHSLSKHRKSQYCPAGTPKSMEELDIMWAGGQSATIDQRAKRLVIFGPDNSVYSQLYNRWEKVYFYPQIYGELKMPINDILKILVSTITAV